MGEHVLFRTGIRRLGSNERGFFYRYPGTGETVREERVLTRIENLKVPPAWEDARIARSPSAKVQAIGYDSAGRLQYLYHPKYRERKEREKFERILRFSDALPTMRRTTSNQLQHKVVTDARLRRVVEECVALPGYEVFKYFGDSGEIRDVKSRDLNAYVKEVMGSEFTPKDFRTWAGTLFAAVKLAELGATEDSQQAEKNVLEAVDDVANRLGNTKDIARASYISPRVIDHYMEGSVVEYHAEQLEEVIAAEQKDL